MNEWKKLEGKLSKEIMKHDAIGVKGWNEKTRMLTDKESIEQLVKHNLSSVYKEYKLL